MDWVVILLAVNAFLLFGILYSLGATLDRILAAIQWLARQQRNGHSDHLDRLDTIHTDLSVFQRRHDEL